MQMMIAAVCSFLLSVIFGRLFIPMLHALKAGQSIREIGPNWHQVKSGTPTMGGIIFIPAIMLCVIVGGIGAAKNGDWSHILVLVFSLCYGLIGFLDDFFKVKLKRNLGLTAKQKFALQLVVAVIYLLVLYKTGSMSSELYIPFAQTTLSVSPVVYVIFAAFVLVGCVNAVNLTDGIDGLATGVTMPVMAFFAITAFCWKMTALSIVPAAVFGALGGFLCYNFHPAKVFMGDTGSLFLGAMVCGMAFALDMPLILVLVGLIYLIETVSVMMQVSYFKLTHGKRIFKMTPIHHHFELCGWSEVKIFTVAVSITVFACLLAGVGIFARY